MDYSIYNTVEKVFQRVDSLTLEARKVLDVPWNGRRLDVERIEKTIAESDTPTRLDAKPTPTTTSTAEEDECHILIPYSKMKEWISSNMNCRHCRGKIHPKAISKSTVGLATQLHFECDTKKCRSLQKRTMEAEKAERNTEDKRVLRSASAYAANWRLLMATQLFGEAQKAGEIVTGFLDLAPSAFQKNWWNMEGELADVHQELASEITETNLKDSMIGKVPDITGKVPLTVSFDMGWQKRGRSYNSLSGHAFLIDVHTGKVVAMEVYSKKCLKCSNFAKQGLTTEEFPDHKCAKNYEGSSKGMEATAALAMVKRLFEHELVQAYVKEMVLDDDASTRALLSHCLSELAQFVVGYEWPRDSLGQKISKAKDVGKLPLNHPIITFLADLMHRIRCFGKYAFALALAPQSTSTLTLVDAYRLKRNFAYWLLSYHSKDFSTFQEKSSAVGEHHFDNHEFCDDWCAMKKADATQKAILNLKYRCKKTNPKMYDDVMTLLQRFTTPEKLKECHHGHSSQKNEAMNQSITRYNPKTNTFSLTMSLNARICLAVGVDSVGHEEYYERLFEKMKIRLPDTCRKMLRRMKSKKDYDRMYQGKPSRKRIRATKKFVSQQDNYQTQKADKAIGLAYDSGMAMQDSGNEKAAGGAKRPKGLCRYCLKSGHLTTRSKGCDYYGWEKQELNKEMMRVHAKRVTEEAVGVATAVEPSEVQSEGTCDYLVSHCDTENMQ